MFFSLIGYMIKVDIIIEVLLNQLVLIVKTLVNGFDSIVEDIGEVLV